MLYYKPKGYTAGGHYYPCPKCEGLGVVTVKTRAWSYSI